MILAVQVAHSHGIMHCDLKPANFILVKRPGVVSGSVPPAISVPPISPEHYVLKLCDFGVARQLEGGVTHLTERAPFGTVRYMAPEMVQNSRSDGNLHITKAVDIWSLGVVLHQLLHSGRTPHTHMESRGKLRLLLAIADEGAARVKRECPRLLPQCGNQPCSSEVGGDAAKKNSTNTTQHDVLLGLQLACLPYAAEERSTIDELATLLETAGQFFGGPSRPEFPDSERVAALRALMNAVASCRIFSNAGDLEVLVAGVGPPTVGPTNAIVAPTNVPVMAVVGAGARISRSETEQEQRNVAIGAEPSCSVPASVQDRSKDRAIVAQDLSSSHPSTMVVDLEAGGMRGTPAEKMSATRERCNSFCRDADESSVSRQNELKGCFGRSFVAIFVMGAIILGSVFAARSAFPHSSVPPVVPDLSPSFVSPKPAPSAVDSKPPPGLVDDGSHPNSSQGPRSSSVVSSSQEPERSPERGSDEGPSRSPSAASTGQSPVPDRRFEADKKAALAAVMADGYALQFVSAALKDDRDVVRAAVLRSGGALVFASETLRGDRGVVLAAVREDGTALRFASEILRGDRGVVLAAVGQNGSALKYVPETRGQNEKDVVLAAVRVNALALRFASERLRDDVDVVLAAVEQNGFALELASERLRDDEGVGLAAVGQEGFALQFASVRLRNNKGVVLAAVSRSCSPWQFASETLRADRDVVERAGSGWSW